MNEKELITKELELEKTKKVVKRAFKQFWKTVLKDASPEKKKLMREGFRKGLAGSVLASWLDEDFEI
jgi:hypothetical protein